MATARVKFSIGDIIKDILENPESSVNNEMEIRFRTMTKTKLTKLEFDNIIKKIKSLNFTTLKPLGEYQLKIQGESGNIRTEVKGLSSIQSYCKSDTLVDNTMDITYMSKRNASIGKVVVNPIDNDDFGFRVSYQSEDMKTIQMPDIVELKTKWDTTKKNFRFINRVSFTNPSFPFKIDMSVVKSSYSAKHTTIKESGVFNSNETYEVEIEVLNDMIKSFGTVKMIETMLKNTIKIILSGIQNTNYPISIQNETQVKNAYYKLLHGKEKSILSPRDFCGPSSFTLELKNIQPLTEDTTLPNIHNNYTVTDKADGVRKLLFIDPIGKVYLITMAIGIEFTGIIITDETLFNTILDGEYILHDKNGNFFDTFAAFDIYYYNGESVRDLSFAPLEKISDPSKYRLSLMKTCINDIKKSAKMVSKKEINMKITAKTFYIGSESKSIFAGCREILMKEQNGLFPYETDGMIFTPSQFGVGGNKEGETTKPMKTAWIHSFKWKPAEFNTIDFLISVNKNKSGEEIIGNIFKNGMDTTTNDQIIQYKSMVLRVGFDQSKHGFLNSCSDVLNDNYLTKKEFDEDSYKPVPFYPSNPYDNTAHKCNVVLKPDATGSFVMICKNGDIIEDNSIVEFSFDTNETESSYRWKPLRVRYDKTSELKAGQKNYGNAYHAANGNWHSIHMPITADMLATGQNIPEDIVDDVYYNRKTTKSYTKNLRFFHNIGVKNRLINSVSKRGNTLIDFTVGKAGDLSKWTNANIGFVLGLDLSRDNIENNHDGACTRYLKAKQSNRSTPYALFVNGDSSLNIRSGLALFTEKNKEIVKSIFGDIPLNERFGPAVSRQYGVATNGFDVGSCQFGLHYFFQNNDILQAFVRNLSECIKEGGYFIGTCYDGNKVFNQLKDKKRGEGVSIYENEQKIWEISKDYDHASFNGDETSVGYPINVFQETINKTFKEYLVNLDYFTRVMENYGFKPITDTEAVELDIPSSLGNFEKLYKKTFNMTPNERQISFLNTYFIFKKIRSVDAEKVKLQNTDSSASEIETNINETLLLRKKTVKKKQTLNIV